VLFLLFIKCTLLGFLFTPLSLLSPIFLYSRCFPIEPISFSHCFRLYWELLLLLPASFILVVAFPLLLFTGEKEGEEKRRKRKGEKREQHASMLFLCYLGRFQFLFVALHHPLSSIRCTLCFILAPLSLPPAQWLKLRPKTPLSHPR